MLAVEYDRSKRTCLGNVGGWRLEVGGYTLKIEDSKNNVERIRELDVEPDEIIFSQGFKKSKNQICKVFTDLMKLLNFYF